MFRQERLQLAICKDSSWEANEYAILRDDGLSINHAQGLQTGRFSALGFCGTDFANGQTALLASAVRVGFLLIIHLGV